MIKAILNLPISFAQSLLNMFSKASRKLRKKLNQPIQANFLSSNAAFQSIIVGLIVYGFAFLIQPFGISLFSSPNKNSLLMALSFSAVVGMGISLFALPALFSTFFKRQDWIVSRAILGNIITAFFVGLFVMVFGNQTGLTQFDLPIELLKFTAIIAAISLIYNFVLESSLSKKFKHKSVSITNKIVNEGLVENKSKVFPITKFVGANDVISLIPNQLIKVEITKYSSEFVYQNLFGTAVKTLNIPENEVHKELGNFEQFIKIDKNIFVNKNAISKATGDAAGINIAVHKVDSTIRVSKKYLSSL